MAYEGDIQNYAPAEVDEVGRIILKARELLSDPAKWTKYEFGFTGEAHCILGALGWRRGECTLTLPINIDAVQRRIADALPPRASCKVSNPHRAIMKFNDRKATTHADVLALLDRAAQSPSPKGPEQ